MSVASDPRFDLCWCGHVRDAHVVECLDLVGGDGAPVHLCSCVGFWLASPWLCARCGRVLVGDAECSAHIAPVGFSAVARARDVARVVRAWRERFCPVCTANMGGVDALPGVEAVCSACKSPLVFVAEGWVHSARI